MKASSTDGNVTKYMKTTICSFSDNRVESIRLNETESMFDWRCPECGKPIMIDWDAKEQRRQRQATQKISARIQNLAEELDTPSYEPSRIQSKRCTARSRKS